MKTKSKILFAVWIMAIAIVSSVLFPMKSSTSYAASVKLTKLKAGKTYKNYDVTGDGKKDIIKLSKEKCVDSFLRNYTVTVTVNKKASFTVLSCHLKNDIRIFHNGKKGALLSINTYSTAGNEVFGYTYSKSGFKKKLLSRGIYTAKVTAKGNKLVVSGPINICQTNTKRRTYTLKGCKLK